MPSSPTANRLIVMLLIYAMISVNGALIEMNWIKKPKFRLAAFTVAVTALATLLAGVYFGLIVPSRQKATLHLVETLSEPMITIEGREINLATISRDEYPVIIVNFWASWCPPCAEELPSLLKLVRKFEGKILVLAISEDESLEKMTAFLKNYGQLPSSFVVVWDKNAEYKKKFKVDKLPESWIFDNQRILDKKINGYEDWGTPGAIQYFKDLIER